MFDICSWFTRIFFFMTEVSERFNLEARLTLLWWVCSSIWIGPARTWSLTARGFCFSFHTFPQRKLIIFNHEMVYLPLRSSMNFFISSYFWLSLLLFFLFFFSLFILFDTLFIGSVIVGISHILCLLLRFFALFFSIHHRRY